MPAKARFRATLTVVCVSLTLIAARVSGQATADVRSQLKVADSAHLQVLTLRDGSTLIGRIVAVAQDTLTVESSVGQLSVPIASVRRVQEVASDRMKNGEYWFPNPNATRLFFAPSGRMLEKGDGYVSDYEVFFPGVAVGVTDNISIGGGMSLFPAGLDEQLFYLTPKIGGALQENVNVAVGALIIGGISDESTVGIVYGVGTFGSPDASLTAGLGYGFSGTTMSRTPVAMLGGELRVSRRIGLVTENYIIPDTDANPIFSYGVRLMGEKMTVDLALFNAGGSGSAIGLPFVDFVFRF
ncbi:MAG: hypothetical protein ACJ8AE_09655 [Gemmatimonadaceae bacterium]